VLILVSSTALPRILSRGLPEWQLRPGVGWLLATLGGLGLLIVLLRQYRRPRNLLHGLALGGLGVALALLAVALAKPRADAGAGDPLPPGVQLRIENGRLTADGAGRNAVTLSGRVVAEALPAGSLWTFEVRVLSAPPPIAAPRRPTPVGDGKAFGLSADVLTQVLGLTRVHDAGLRHSGSGSFTFSWTQAPGSAPFTQAGPVAPIEMELQWTQLRLDQVGSIPFEEGARFQGQGFDYQILTIPAESPHELKTRQVTSGKDDDFLPLFILASGEGAWLGIERSAGRRGMSGVSTRVLQHRAYAELPAEPIVRVDLYRLAPLAQGRERMQVMATVGR
jgi:hypothetical protein